MNQQRQNDVVEIDLLDVFWRVLAAWKPLIIVAVICGLLASGARYYLDVRNYNAAASSQTESPKTVSADLEEKDRDAVDAQLYNLEMVLQDRSDAKKDITMQIDPEHEYRTVMSFLLSASPDKLDAVGAAVRQRVSGTDFLQAVGEVVSPKSDVSYIDQIVSISQNEDNWRVVSGSSSSNDVTVVSDGDNSGDEDSSLLFSLSVMWPGEPDASDEGDLVSAVTDQMNSISSETGETIAPNQVSLVWNETREYVDDDLESTQRNVMSGIMNNEKAIDDAYESFSDDQKAYYNAAAVKLFQKYDIAYTDDENGVKSAESSIIGSARAAKITNAARSGAEAVSSDSNIVEASSSSVTSSSLSLNASSTEDPDGKVNADKTHAGKDKENGAALQKPGFSGKYFAIGFILGFLLVIFIEVLKIVLRGRVEAESTLNTKGIRNFGGLYDYHGANLWQKFVRDPLVWNLRYRKAKKIDESAAAAASGAAEYLKFRGMNHAALVYVGAEANAKVSENAVNRLKSGLEAAGISTEKAEQCRQFEDGTGVILLIVGGRSRRKDLNRELTFAKDYCQEIVGGVYIGV